MHRDIFTINKKNDIIYTGMKGMVIYEKENIYNEKKKGGQKA